MRTVAELGETERSELFSETAAKMGINPAAVEKDFWLCWVLMIIFEDPDLSKIFKLKGGTSLSKCYNLIDRFSEDIDLILDWEVLTTEDPYENRSKTQQDKFNKELNEIAEKYLKDNFQPAIEANIKPICKSGVDATEGHIINVEYPQLFKDPYLRPRIKLEIGPLASMVPFDNFSVKSYAAEEFPEVFEQADTDVTAVLALRTFWEKVTIFHAEANRPEDNEMPHRFSRHYYDVFKMLDTPIAEDSLNDLVLLGDVVSFKSRFYKSSWANYEQAKPGTFKLIPNEDRIKSLKDDYKEMKEMIFGDYPDFDLILSKLADLETQINNL